MWGEILTENKLLHYGIEPLKNVLFDYKIYTTVIILTFDFKKYIKSFKITQIDLLSQGLDLKVVMEGVPKYNIF